MITKSFARHDAERLLPLVRAIGREIEERTRTAAELVERLTEVSADAPEHREELTRLESELSTARRELRRAEKELERLGCSLDGDHPLRVIFPGSGETFAWEGPLDRTTFYRRISERAAT
jgi:hypothetical protein